MKVTISVLGRFWAFNLASELHRHGHLHRLITTYPKFEVVKYGVPREFTASNIAVELLKRGWSRIPRKAVNGYNPQFVFKELGDYLASIRIPEETDIFVGWSSSALHSLRRAKSYGAITVLERGSTHMGFQTNILQEEYERLGLQPQIAEKKVYDKELCEYEEADYIAVPSEFSKDSFLKYGIRDNKLLHIPWGVDIGEFKPVSKEDDVFRIIFSGGIILRKGVHYLLQAFGELNLPDAELWLIGSLSDEALPFISKYDNGRISIKGPFRQKELYRHYSQGSVFCLPSIEDGFGLVVPQAMACGLPVITSDNTGAKELIQEGKDGFIVPIRNVAALKEKLLYLYKNKNTCEEMGQNARTKVINYFTWDQYGNKMVKAYQDLLRINALR